MTLDEAKKEARSKAFSSLAKYKFMMFGYHAALPAGLAWQTCFTTSPTSLTPPSAWVTLNRLDSQQEPNPFKNLVNLARETPQESTKPHET